MIYIVHLKNLIHFDIIYNNINSFDNSKILIVNSVILY